MKLVFNVHFCFLLGFSFPELTISDVYCLHFCPLHASAVSSCFVLLSAKSKTSAKRQNDGPSKNLLLIDSYSAL